jgi:metallo-beta-lactamase family protein
MSAPTLTFIGGVGTVTGSKHLLDTGRAKILLDCGLFQGPAELRRRNWQSPPFDWSDIDAVVLTHAHLDHSGYLPVLAHRGWRGPVYCTEGTARLAEIVLADSAHLLEEEARRANEGGWSKHRPALPLYDRHDAAAAVRLLHPVAFSGTVALAGSVELRLGRAGHILGSSWAALTVPSGDGSRTLAVSGDLGRPNHPLLLPPEPRPVVDHLLLESTYGNRTHESWDTIERLADAIRRTARRGGSVLIPAFAVDRTEVLLHELVRLREAGDIPDLPVVVDSPMALACLDVYREAVKNCWPELRPSVAEDALLDPVHLVEVSTAEESARWNDPRMPAVIVSASGMASGGRVLHHLEGMLSNRRHTVVLVGFAAAGTRARQLLDGATEIKIHGRYIPVRAEILTLSAFSAHADADELVDWATAAPAPSACFVVHGEPAASHALARRLHDEHGWTAVVPSPGEQVLL